MEEQKKTKLQLLLEEVKKVFADIKIELEKFSKEAEIQTQGNFGLDEYGLNLDTGGL